MNLKLLLLNISHYEYITYLYSYKIIIYFFTLMSETITSHKFLNKYT